MYGLTELAPDRTTGRMDVRGDSEVEHVGWSGDRTRGLMDMLIDCCTNGAEADAELAANERMDGWMYGWIAARRADVGPTRRHKILEEDWTVKF